MSPTALRQLLSTLPKPNHPDLLVGVNTMDDAGVFRLRDDLALVQTVDFFTPIVDDPYTYGAIASANSLSDIYAMGGEPLTALNIVCFPKRDMAAETLGEILQGGFDKAVEAGCVIVGGHSVDDNEMKYGLSVTGKIHPEKILTNANAQPGDALILTKPLGTGIMATAFKLGSISESQYEEMTQAMMQLNKIPSEIALQFNAHACTDITGYSLLGHAWEMAQASHVGMVLYACSVPMLSGVLKFAEEGYLTGGDVTNREYTEGCVQIDPKISEARTRVLFDPQTSGGLLVAMQSEQAEAYVQEARRQKIQAAIIGRVTRERAGKLLVVEH